MFREYQDVRIKRNLKYVKVFSTVALVLWAVCTIGYLAGKWGPFEWVKQHPRADISSSYLAFFWGGADIWRRILRTQSDYNLWSEEIQLDILYCLVYLDLALLTYGFSKTNLTGYAVKNAAVSQKTEENAGEYAGEPKGLTGIKGRISQSAQKWAKKLSTESKHNNDFSKTFTYIIFNFIPVAVGAMLILSVTIAAMAGTVGDIAGGVILVASHLGGMFLSHLFLVISGGLLIQNCVLIKREWKTDPPQFLIEEQQNIDKARKNAEEQAQRQKDERDTATCKDLLEQCGMQFFIEYYPQLKRLPIPDITLSDHFSGEREVRLPPAKKIIDSGLAECALHYIIETYGDIFSSEVIGRAQSILEEIKNEKTEEN